MVVVMGATIVAVVAMISTMIVMSGITPAISATPATPENAAGGSQQNANAYQKKDKSHNQSMAHFG